MVRFDKDDYLTSSSYKLDELDYCSLTFVSIFFSVGEPETMNLKYMHS